MTNKLTLLIDGNWLLQSRFSVMMDMFNKMNNEQVREAASRDLQERMARSINITINRFPEIDNIVMVTDGGSWRKKLEIPSQLTTTYKGNRVHDEQIDWTRIYKALNRITDRCRELGITTSTYLNSEGDDWMWYWSRKLNSEGTNCIIWSSDNDLKQLAQVDGGTFTGWYNDKKGLYLPIELKEPELDDVDFFLMPCTESTLVTRLKQHTIIEYVDPNDVIIPKIICGDTSDNIKSIIRYQKNGRNYGVGAKEWSKIQSALGIKTIQDFTKHVDDIANYFCNSTKYVGLVNKSDILEMLDYNTKLVWLNEAVIPDTIIQAMNQSTYYTYDISFIKDNYLILTEQDKHVEEIFEGVDFDAPF